MVYDNKGLLVRFFYLVISMLVWVFSFGGRLFSSNNVILCYHGIDASNARSFIQQMQSISDRVVPLDSVRTNEQENFIRPAIVITFDDAFENLINNAFPVIDELQIPVSIYVVTGFLGDKPGWLKGTNHYDEYNKLMDSNQVRKLSCNPLVSLGTHTHSHQKLTDIDSHAVEFELCKSKYVLEDLIGKEVVSLAFPHGDFNTEVLELARASGLTQFLTLEEQMVSANQPQGKIGRFSMEPNVWPIEFRLTVDGAYSWLFYFRKIIRLVRRSVGK